MLIALLAGTLLGLVLAMPPGPVGVTAIKMGIYDGKKHGIKLALGTGLLDVVYCLIAIFATSAAVDTIESFASGYPIFMVIFQLTVIAAFVAIGILNLKKSKSSPKLLIDEKGIVKGSKLIERSKTKGPFLLGIAIALTNIANPTFMPSLAYVSLQVHQIHIFTNIAVNNALFSVGFGLGNFLWLYLLISIVAKYKAKMSSRMLLRVHQFTGFTFLGFGTLLGYRMLAFTKWPEVLRLAFAF
ncbi:MAG: LysE family transporter [Candidatus Kapaibacterium sp.]